MPRRHTFGPWALLVPFILAGRGGNERDRLPDRPSVGPSIDPSVGSRGAISEAEREEMDQFRSEFDRMWTVHAVETKRLNWNMIPESEKALRTTTGKVVFEGTDSRLIVSHYEDGAPRFAIQQSTPTSIGKFAAKTWITFGAQDAWTPNGSHIRFFAEDTTPFGTWVLTDSAGRTRAEIVFENHEHTGELLRAYFHSRDGDLGEGMNYDIDRGTWSGRAADQDRVREIEDAIRFVRECLLSAAQL